MSDLESAHLHYAQLLTARVGPRRAARLLNIASSTLAAKLARFRVSSGTEAKIHVAMLERRGGI